MWTLHQRNESSYRMGWHSRSRHQSQRRCLTELPAESASGATNDRVVIDVAEDSAGDCAGDPFDEDGVVDSP
jgi:hypothetical protein